MKGCVIALDHLPDGREAAAAMVDGRLHDLLIDPPADRGKALPGAIYRGLPDRPLKGAGGVFVRLPHGETGFLRDAKGVAPGKPLLVQVSTVGEPGKAPPVTRRLIIKGRYAIVTPGAPGRNIARSIRDEQERDRLGTIAADAAGNTADKMGLIIRSAAEGVGSDTVAADIHDLLDLTTRILTDTGTEPDLLFAAPTAHVAAWRDWADLDPDDVDDAPGSFERNGVWDTVQSLISARVDLDGGAFMFVESTRACVTVDVNTGADGSPAAGLKANVAALRKLPRELTLRGYAGQVVIDPAPYPRRERPQLEQVLLKALRGDSTDTTLAGWTPLGHLELQRKRDRLPLTEVLADGLPDL